MLVAPIETSAFEGLTGGIVGASGGSAEESSESGGSGAFVITLNKNKTVH